MKRLIQLIKLIFVKEFHNSIEHYAQDEIVRFYKAIEQNGLFPDEMEVLKTMQNMKVRRILLIGAGTGREAKVFAENDIKVCAIEPVDQMRENAFIHEGITYFKNMEDVPSDEEAIYLTRNLLSLLNKDARKQLIDQIFKRMNAEKVLFFQADIMVLSWRNSFKLKMLEQLGKLFKLQKRFEVGDTYRLNIDYNAKNSTWCYYHYFSTKDALLSEIKNLNNPIKIEELSCGFFKLQLVEN